MLTGPASPASGVPVSVGSAQLRLGAGATGVVDLPVRLSATPAPLDVMVLLDVSGSMARRLPLVEREVAREMMALQQRGLDVRAGLAIAGTTPPTQDGGAVSTPAHSPDPRFDPYNASYRPPVPFRRVLPVSTLSTFLPALGAVRSETYPASVAFGFRTYGRQQGQLLGLHQLLTGEGYQGSANDDLQDAVPAGQVAGWRPDASRVLLDVTDQTFDHPDGTPRTAGGEADVALVGRELQEQRVRHVGIVSDDFAAAVTDVGRLSTATATVAGPAGRPCAGLHGSLTLPAGAPLVCETSAVGNAIEEAVATLRPAGVVAATVVPDPHLLSVAPSDLGPLSATADHLVSLRVTLTCPTGSAAGRHVLDVTATWLGHAATGQIALTCLAAQGVTGSQVVDPPVGVSDVAPPPAGPAPVAPVPGAAPPLPPAVPAAAPAAALAAQPVAVPQIATGVSRQVQEQQAAVFLFTATAALASFALLVARRQRQQQERASRIS